MGIVALYNMLILRLTPGMLSCVHMEQISRKMYRIKRYTNALSLNFRSNNAAELLSAARSITLFFYGISSLRSTVSYGNKGTSAGEFQWLQKSV